MPDQPGEVAEIEEEAIRLFEESQKRVVAEQAKIIGLPPEERDRLFRRDRRLTDMQNAIDGELLTLREGMGTWIGSSFPNVYQYGGTSGALSVGGQFGWSQVHLDAVNVLAEDMFADVLSITDYVSDDTKRWIRDAGRVNVAGAIIEGKSPREAARDLVAGINDSGVEPINSITYANGAKHNLDDYASMLIRSKTANAYNAGTLNFAEQAGVSVFEIFDGADCGLTSHDDPQKANGLIIDGKTARDHTISHPNCRRAFGPRPDLTEADVGRRKPSTTKDQRADQAAFEVANLSRSRQQRTARAAQLQIGETRITIDSLLDRLDIMRGGTEAAGDFVAEYSRTADGIHRGLAEVAKATLATKKIVDQSQQIIQYGQQLLEQFDIGLEFLNDAGNQQFAESVLKFIMNDPANASIVMAKSNDLLGWAAQTGELREFASDWLQQADNIFPHLLGATDDAGQLRTVGILGDVRLLNRSARRLVDGAETIIDASDGIAGSAQRLLQGTGKVLDQASKLVDTIDNVSIRAGADLLVDKDRLYARLVEMAAENLDAKDKQLTEQILGLRKRIGDVTDLGDLGRPVELLKVAGVDAVRARTGFITEAKDLGARVVNIRKAADEAQELVGDLVAYRDRIADLYPVEPLLQIRSFDDLKGIVDAIRVDTQQTLLVQAARKADEVKALEADLRVAIRDGIQKTKAAKLAFDDSILSQKGQIRIATDQKKWLEEQLSTAKSKLNEIQQFTSKVGDMDANELWAATRQAFDDFERPNLAFPTVPQPPAKLVSSWRWLDDVVGIQDYVYDDVKAVVEQAKVLSAAGTRFIDDAQPLVQSVRGLIDEVTEVRTAADNLFRRQTVYLTKVENLVDDVKALGDNATRARLTSSVDTARKPRAPRAAAQAANTGQDTIPSTGRIADDIFDATVPPASSPVDELAATILAQVDETVPDVLLQEADRIKAEAKKARQRRTQLRRRVQADDEAMELIDRTGLTLDEYIDAVEATDRLKSAVISEFKDLHEDLLERMPTRGIQRPKPLVKVVDPISAKVDRRRVGELGDFDWLDPDLERRLYRGDDRYGSGKQVNGWFLEKGSRAVGPDEMVGLYADETWGGYQFANTDEAMAFWVEQADYVDAVRAASESRQVRTWNDIDFNNALSLSPRDTTEFQIYDINTVINGTRQEAIAHVAASRVDELARYVDDPDFLYRSPIDFFPDEFSTPGLGAGPPVTDMTLDTFVAEVDEIRGEWLGIQVRRAAGTSTDRDVYLVERFRELVDVGVIDVDRVDEYTTPELFFRIRKVLDDPEDYAQLLEGDDEIAGRVAARTAEIEARNVERIAGGLL